MCALAASTLCSPAFAGGTQTMPDSGRLLRVIERLATHQPVRIIAFGSSSTEGAGASSPAATYPSRLQVVLNAAWEPRQHVIVLNRGIGGEDADDMMQRLPALIAEHPDLIIWQTGSNDPLRNVPLERFEQETRAGIEADPRRPHRRDAARAAALPRTGRQAGQHGISRRLASHR